MKKKTIRSFRQKRRNTGHGRVKPLTEAIRAYFRSLPLDLAQRQGCQQILPHRNTDFTLPRTMASAAVCAVALAVSNQEALASSGYFAPAIPSRISEQIVSRKEIVFMDMQVPDYERLIKGIKPGREVILLDPDRDGVAQITAVLARHTDTNAVHIVSHGQSGRLQLGNSWLSMDKLDEYALALQRWFPAGRKSVNGRPEVVIYACAVAEGSLGKAFVERVSELTGADITASNDRTGAAGLGGDWDMEMATGSIEAGLAFTPQALVDYPFALDVFTVTNLGDSGPGSLRQAIVEANAIPGADDIVFEGDGANGTIELATDLPDITDDLSINGPGAETLTIKGGDLNFVVLNFFNDIYYSRHAVSDITIAGGSIGADPAQVAVKNAVLIGSKGPAIRGPRDSVFTLENTVITGSCSESDPEPGPYGCAAVKMSDYVNVYGSLTLKNSVISGSGGNGVFASAGTALENSTIEGSSGFGVVVGEREVCSLYLENSTISHNKGDGIYDGGICDERLHIKVLNSTISGNSGNGVSVSENRTYANLRVEIENSTIAGNGGKGTTIERGEEEFAYIELRNTIVANNALKDCDNRVESLGNNLIGDPQGCDIVLQATDLTGDPGLGDFVDPGTPGGGRLPLLATSQAIDAGNDAACPETDQLGHPRGDGDGDGSIVCDIGAVEFYPVVNDLVLLANTEKSFDPAPVTGAPAGTFTLTATFSNASSTLINNPFFEVKFLTGENVLLNSDSGAGGVGASLTPDVGDNVLSPGESVTVDFKIGLQEAKRFRFFVNLLGDSSL